MSAVTAASPSVRSGGQPVRAYSLRVVRPMTQPVKVVNSSPRRAAPSRRSRPAAGSTRSSSVAAYARPAGAALLAAASRPVRADLVGVALRSASSTRRYASVTGSSVPAIPTPPNATMSAAASSRTAASTPVALSASRCLHPSPPRLPSHHRAPRPTRYA